MTDYIDRQAAIEAIEKLILPQTKGETMAEEINRVAWRCAINCAEEMIGHLPTIEVEPVTRCRDCKFYTEEERWCRRLGLCGAFAPNDYCSHAEEGSEDGE